LIYNRDTTSQEFKQYVLDTYNEYNNLTISLVRATDVGYEETGRNQCLSDACIVDEAIQNLLRDNDISHTSISSGPESVNVIAEKIMNAMSSNLKVAVKFENV